MLEATLKNTEEQSQYGQRIIIYNFSLFENAVEHSM